MVEAEKRLGQASTKALSRARQSAMGALRRAQLGINGVLACSGDVETERLAMISVRATGKLVLADRLERAWEEGDLPASSKSRAPVKYGRDPTAEFHDTALDLSRGD